jgi:hypothetical protein
MSLHDEPRYVDDPWEDEDNWWEPRDLIHQDELKQAFSVCKRSFRFKSRSERTKWARIDKQLGEGKIPLPWFEAMVDWAAQKNRRNYPKVIIKLPALANTILNKSRMEEWLSEHPEEAQEWLEDLGWDTDKEF